VKGLYKALNTVEKNPAYLPISGIFICADRARFKNAIAQAGQRYLIGN
jgi:hypothetical protein